MFVFYRLKVLNKLMGGFLYFSYRLNQWQSGESRRAHFWVAVYWLLNKKTLERVTFRLKGFTAIVLFRSIKLSNSEDHKQALLGNNNSKDLLKFSFLPQLYHVGKMDLNLQFIFDLRPQQLRHDEVLLNRSGFLSD